MKKGKKLVSLLLTMAVTAGMMLATGASTFADTVDPTDRVTNSASVKVESADGTVDLSTHNFAAYQVLSGSFSDGKYVDLAFGPKIAAGDLLSALKGNAVIGADFSGFAADSFTAASFADTITAYEADKLAALSNVLSAYVKTLTPDESFTGTDTAAIGIGYYVIMDMTSVEGGDDAANSTLLFAQDGDNVIKVKTSKPTLTKEIKHNESGAWGTVGDNQIGDRVEFRITTSIPNVVDYDTYTYTIHDTLSEGLTLVPESVKVYTDESLTVELEAGRYAVETSGIGAESLNVEIQVKTAGGKIDAEKLYTVYSAVLNGSAKIYTQKNENTAYLEYDNNPNGEGKGKTSEVKVYDWTFSVALDKYAASDSGKTPIADAKFVLTKNSAFNAAPETDGTLTDTSELISLVKVDETTYRIAAAGESGTTYYIDTVAGENIKIQGIDDETSYYLYETKAPAGYNRLTTTTEFSIKADYAGGTGENAPTLTYTNATDGVVEIENKSGITLPSTGGIGTTILYIAGAALVLGAGALLIVKRRKDAEAEEA